MHFSNHCFLLKYWSRWKCFSKWALFVRARVYNLYFNVAK